MRPADARVVRTSSSAPGKRQATSPFASQSNSGPRRRVVGMNPSGGPPRRWVVGTGVPGLHVPIHENAIWVAGRLGRDGAP